MGHGCSLVRFALLFAGQVRVRGPFTAPSRCALGYLWRSRGGRLAVAAAPSPAAVVVPDRPRPTWRSLAPCQECDVTTRSRQEVTRAEQLYGRCASAGTVRTSDRPADRTTATTSASFFAEQPRAVGGTRSSSSKRMAPLKDPWGWGFRRRRQAAAHFRDARAGALAPATGWQLLARRASLA